MNNYRLLSSKAILFAVILVSLSLISFSPGSALENLSEEQMGDVTGREGLAIDLDLDASANALKFRDPSGFQNSGNSGTLLLSNLTMNNDPGGSGGQADLNNMTLDSDDSQGLVLGAPNGSFTANIDDLCLSTTFSNNNCSGDIYGNVRAEDLSLINSVVRVTGRNEGVSADMDLNINISSLQLRDRDGADGTGDPGAVDLRNIHLGDRSGANAPGGLTGMTIDADPNQGLVVGLPSSSNFDVEIGDVVIPAGGNGVGQFYAENINPDGSELRFISNTGGGIDVSGDFKMVADEAAGAPSMIVGALTAFAFDPTAGLFLIASTVDAHGITIDNGSGGPFSFSGLTFDVEGGAQPAVVVDFPGSGAFVEIDHTELGPSLPAFGVNMNNFRNNSIAWIRPNNEGISLDVDLDMAMASASISDENGDDCVGCNGNEGAITLGGGSSNSVMIESVDNPDEAGTVTDLTGMTIDVDGSGGANGFSALRLRAPSNPSGDVSVDVDDVYLGNTSSSAFGVDINNVDFNPAAGQSTMQISGVP